MIHDLSIIKQNKIIFSHQYWNDSIENHSEKLINLIESNIKDTTVLPILIPYENMNIILNEANDLLFFLITDSESQLQDYYLKLEEVKRLIESSQKELEKNSWSTTGSIYDNFIIAINKILITISKICVIGTSNVGKKTFVKKLTSEDLVTETIPSIAVEAYRIPGLYKSAYEIYVWDYSNEESFDSFIDHYLKDMSLAIFLTDSTPINVRKTKEILNQLRNKLPRLPITIVANKQDQPNVWPPKMIERVLAIPTHGIALADPRNDSKLVTIFKFATNLIHK